MKIYNYINTSKIINGAYLLMEKKMSKKRITVLCIIAFVILAMLVGVIGYMLGWFNKGYDADVVTVSKRNITATFDTSGTVSAKSEGNFTLVPGVKVTKVNVKVGSSVKKGDVLAEFDASSLNQTLSEKKSALDKAQKAYNDYKKSVSTAKSQLSSIDSQISAAQAKVNELEKKSNNQKNGSAGTAQKDQAQSAQNNLSSLIGDSSLAGKIIDNIVSSSKSLQEIKSMLDKISSADEGTISQIISSMGAMSAGSSQYELAQAQLELASLKISKATAQTQSNGDLESIYKSIYESAQKGYDNVKSSIDALNAGWVAAEDGIVSEVNITEGETVEAKESTSLSSGFDISSIVSAVTSGGNISDIVGGFFSADETGVKVQYYPLEISFMLNKGDLSKVSVGKSVTVKSETGKELHGEVSYIAAVATSSSGVDINSLLGTSSGSTGGIEAKVTLNEADSGVIIGLDADVSIETEEKNGCLTVPVESIQYDESHAYVFVYDPNKKIINRKLVETGIFDGTYYEITSGISEGDIIVRTPVATMKDEDKIIAHNVDKT